MVALQLQSVGAYHGRKLFVEEVTTPVMTAGELVAVIGPNAAGKSTLFKRITGILKGPGNVHIEGARAKSPIAYMPQDTSANAVLTVYESILLARKQGKSWSVSDEDTQLIDAILQALDIAPIAFRDLGALSGGQRQLVSIAQALSRQPDIMLMDEPTSALDLHRQIEVLALMKKQARQNRMIVMIAIHDLNQALRFADKVLVIEQGRMRACGVPRDVVTVDMLREVYRIEARIEQCSMDYDHVIVDGTTRR
ncbi:ABC transporter ATP-binding protein [uncultured Martelella sp.]|uniref:ABC transporter ATP-binding protein n=1 Tax=uncultured Martelella sp. TaxID=392331 RepID=UPI0029C66FD5|nr:ABC transporter ATP-binding protein [uncultured Martelella sp.]